MCKFSCACVFLLTDPKSYILRVCKTDFLISLLSFMNSLRELLQPWELNTLLFEVSRVLVTSTTSIISNRNSTKTQCKISIINDQSIHHRFREKYIHLTSLHTLAMFKPTSKLLATATNLGTQSGFKAAPMALLPPIPLYRRLLRAHRKHLPREMRLLGDEYIKSEFRAHRNVENPVHIVC